MAHKTFGFVFVLFALYIFATGVGPLTNAVRLSLFGSTTNGTVAELIGLFIASGNLSKSGYGIIADGPLGIPIG